ncbi:MAG: hypothetical protein ACI9TI_001724 [Natronomonas sp.]|mgnify:CR=1 FL=1|jgi:uncharacterized protein (DUF2062 family)|uniref:DUF2062 domain-containing protein n=1 Tax=Natronomonas sp. TaxID=2184060 RepID=UPI003988C7AF
MGRVSRYRQRVYAEFEAAFAEQHTPHQVAGSFSIGVFVTTLPSLGLGLVFFLFLTRLSDRISPIAIFSSALVINPLVKAPMFVAAFWIGTRLLGPTETASGGFAEATAVATRMISGFVVIGVAIAAAGYVVVYVLVTQYRKRDVELVEEILDDELLAE